MFKYASTNNTSEYTDHYDLKLSYSNKSENEKFFFKILGGHDVQIYQKLYHTSVKDDKFGLLLSRSISKTYFEMVKDKYQWTTWLDTIFEIKPLLEDYYIL